MVCKSCFRTVQKERRPKRFWNTSSGLRKKRRLFSNVKLPKKLLKPIDRTISTAREQLRTRNRLREINTASCWEDRTKRIRKVTEAQNSLKSLTFTEPTQASTKVDFNLFKMVYDNLKSESKSDKNRDYMKYCPNHKDNLIEYVSSQENIGFCSDCLYTNFKSNSKIIKISDVMDNVKHMLMNIQNDSIKIIHK